MGNRRHCFSTIHIYWEAIHDLNNQNKKDGFQLEEKKSELVSLISCVLKHDWERAKEEIKGSIQTRILIIAFVIGFALFSTCYFLIDYSTVDIYEHLRIYVRYCAIMIGFAFVCILVISHADKWKNGRAWVFTMVCGILIMVLFTVLFHRYVQNIKTLNFIGILIVCYPFLGVAYCFTIKTIKYRNDMGRLIMAIAMITNRQIPQRFRLFVKRNILKAIDKGQFEKYPSERSFYKQKPIAKLDYIKIYRRNR